jgi:hypothetical protein
MRSIVLIASVNGGAAARLAYRSRRAQYSNSPWLAVPDEVALRWACRALADAKRVADAIETCKLNTEIHPWSWHTWFNLALLQREAGTPKEEVLGSAYCSVAVDPGAFNALSTLAYLKKNDPDKKAPMPGGCPAPRP